MNWREQFPVGCKVKGKETVCLIEEGQFIGKVLEPTPRDIHYVRIRVQLLTGTLTSLGQDIIRTNGEWFMEYHEVFERGMLERLPYEDPDYGDDT